MLEGAVTGGEGDDLLSIKLVVPNVTAVDLLLGGPGESADAPGLLPCLRNVGRWSTLPNLISGLTRGGPIVGLAIRSGLCDCGTEPAVSLLPAWSRNPGDSVIGIGV